MLFESNFKCDISKLKNIIQLNKLQRGTQEKENIRIYEKCED